MASTLVLLRHGQSEWNLKNIFTGWVDVSLSDVGKEEARWAGEALKHYDFDVVFVSALRRAQETARIALHGRMPAAYFCSDALNERNYGELQGKNKDEMRTLYGQEQVHIWRRSFDARPPAGESLRDTCERVLPYFKQMVEPYLKKGKTVLISAHGNSLRALIKYIEHLSDEKIVEVEVPTGTPIVYHLDDNLEIIKKEILKK